MDVIINTTSRDLNLRAGAISASILKAAGEELQRECNRKVPPGGINPGEIVVTSGYDLMCKDVYHVALMKWDGANGKAKQVSTVYAVVH